MIHKKTKWKNVAKPIVRTYSRYCREAVSLLSGLIRVVRKERKLTAQEVAARAGISRGLVQRIEKGDLKCEVGAVFEVATIVGVRLFESDLISLVKQIKLTTVKAILSEFTISHRRTGFSAVAYRIYTAIYC